MAVEGATAEFKAIDVGESYEDFGMCRSGHDAVAVVITLPDAPQTSPPKKRRR